MRPSRRPVPTRAALTGTAPARPAPRGGFTLVELLVLIAILVVLLSIFVPYISRVRESDRRVRCSDNLRAIGRALSAYADANAHDYPRVRFDVQRPGYVAFTGADAADPFVADSAVKPNDVTASLWLVVRGGLIGPQQFVCPSSSDSPDPASSGGTQASRRSNFAGGRHLSYSYASPFSTAPKYRLNSDWLPADFAVVGDKNPGTAGGGDVTGPAWNATDLKVASANSANHDRAGQNVLYADGHVQFQKTPYAGFGREAQRDNVYTVHSPAPLPPGVEPPPEANGYCDPNVGPSWQKDSYLVPTDDYQP